MHLLQILKKLYMEFYNPGGKTFETDFSMCETLTSISTYYLTISVYLFAERYLHNVYDIISNNFRSG